MPHIIKANPDKIIFGGKLNVTLGSVLPEGAIYNYSLSDAPLSSGIFLWHTTFLLKDTHGIGFDDWDFRRVSVERKTRTASALSGEGYFEGEPPWPETLEGLHQTIAYRAQLVAVDPGKIKPQPTYPDGRYKYFWKGPKVEVPDFGPFYWVARIEGFNYCGNRLAVAEGSEHGAPRNGRHYMDLAGYANCRGTQPDPECWDPRNAAFVPGKVTVAFARKQPK